MSTTSTTKLIDEWNAWHARRVQRLVADDGWLTLIDLAFLEEGATTMGRGKSNDLSYPNATADRVGRFVKVAETVHFEIAPPAPGESAPLVTVDSQPVTLVQLVPDDQGTPTVLRNGSLSVVLVRRNDRLALRVRDNASPDRLAFTGIDRFPFDPALRLSARVERASAGATISVTNVKGFTRDEPLAATLVLTLDGRECRLAATQESTGRLFVVFGDATNGHSTYAAGRFLDVSVADDGSATVDFNRAYNPPCAFTEFATCPLPVPGNRLPLAIEAGERAPTTPHPER